jgi:hypothetical protein
VAFRIARLRIESGDFECVHQRSALGRCPTFAELDPV